MRARVVWDELPETASGKDRYGAINCKKVCVLNDGRWRMSEVQAEKVV